MLGCLQGPAITGQLSGIRQGLRFHVILPSREGFVINDEPPGICFQHKIDEPAHAPPVFRGVLERHLHPELGEAKLHFNQRVEPICTADHICCFEVRCNSVRIEQTPRARQATIHVGAPIRKVSSKDGVQRIAQRLVVTCTLDADPRADV